MEIDPITVCARSEKKIQQQLKNPQTGAEKKCCLETMAKYATFFHMEESLKTSTKKFDKELVHCFAVFQAIFYSVYVLNRALGSVISLPRISELFNGTFVYNLVVYIVRKPETIKQSFLPPAHSVQFLQTFQLLLDHLPNIKDVTSKPKKQRRTKVRPEPIETSDNIGSERTPSGSENEFFDVENRFSALKVC